MLERADREVTRQLEEQGWENESNDDSIDSSTSDDGSLVEVGRSKRYLGHTERFKQFWRKRAYTHDMWIIAVAFLVLSGARYVVIDENRSHLEKAEEGKANRANLSSVMVVVNALSLVSSLLVATIQDGGLGYLWRVLSWQRIFHFGVIGVLFFMSSVVWIQATIRGSGSKQLAVAIFYLNLPTAAAVSQYYFRRSYGTLHWLSFLMITSAVCAFMALRERYKECPAFSDIKCGTSAAVMWMESDRDTLAVFGALASMLAMVAGSILSERLFRTWTDPFSVLKVNMDFASLIAAGITWYFTTAGATHQPASVTHRYNAYSAWGNWAFVDWILVAVHVSESWSAGLVVKCFDTVTKSVLSALSIVTAVCLTDHFAENLYKYQVRAAPSVLLVAIVACSSLLYQTCQQFVNNKLSALIDHTPKTPRSRATSSIPDDVEQAAAADTESDGDGESTRDTEGAQNLLAPLVCENFHNHVSHFSPWCGRFDVNDEHILREAAKELDGSEGDDSAEWDGSMILISVIYIVNDTTRTLLNSFALRNSEINPNSMSFLSFVIGLVFASCQVWWNHGVGSGKDDNGKPKTKGLLQAWRFRKIFEYSLASILQALTMCMVNMAFAMGLSPPMATVLGKVYTPVLAVGERLYLKKSRVMLEWVAITILTLGTFAFLYLQLYDYETGLAKAMSNVLPLVLCIAGASIAAIQALVSQGIYENNRDVDFYMNKVRFDCGSAFFTLLVIPLLSLTASRPKDLVWLPRPTDAGCKVNECWPKVEGIGSGAGLHWPWEKDEMMQICQVSNCTGPCECSSGLFAGWGFELSGTDITLYAFLAITVFYGILVGIIYDRYGSLHRAKCDAFGLLLTYWVGSPLMDYLTKGISFRDSLRDECLDIVSVIIPLAALASDIGRLNTVRMLQQTTAFRMGLVAGLLSRVFKREVGVAISDAEQVQASNSEEAANFEETTIKLLDQPPTNVVKAGPYVRVVTTMPVSFKSKVQDLFNSLPEKQKAVYIDLRNFVSGEEDEGIDTQVCIGATTKSANHHAIIAATAGVKASAAGMSKTSIRSYGNREKAMCRQDLSKAMESCGKLAEATRDTAPSKMRLELQGMVAKLADEKIAPPVVQFVAEAK